jgi:predicted Na+-dependent transporter
VGVFAAAAYINPYDEDGTPRTMSTHTQLGLAPCNFVVLTGKPCPACGMTTSFALLVRGDVRASLSANWVGTLTAMFWGGMLVWAVVSGMVGRPLFIPHGRGELVLTVLVGLFLALMLGRWAALWFG